MKVHLPVHHALRINFRRGHRHFVPIVQMEKVLIKKQKNVSIACQVPIPQTGPVSFAPTVNGTTLIIMAVLIAQLDKGALYQVTEKKSKSVQETIFLLEEPHLAKNALHTGYLMKVLLNANFVNLERVIEMESAYFVHLDDTALHKDGVRHVKQVL